MKRLIFVVIVVAAIPLGAWLAGTGVESHFRKQWSKQVEKQFGAQGLAAIASGKLSLDRFCSESRTSGEAVCRTFKNVLMLKTASLCAFLAGIALVIGISLAARFASFNRTLLLNIFTPGMKIVLVVLFALILVQGALATYGAYIYEATVIHRVHFILIGGIALGAVLGAAAMIKDGLSISRRASTSVIGKQIPANTEPQLWKFVTDIATRLGAIPPKNIVIGLEPNFYVTAAEVVLLPGSRSLGDETLYLSLPLMRILSREELTAVLGHELGHFKGEDTEYSIKFYPIYAGTAQALTALKNRAHEGARSLALLPASVVLSFFMEQFAQAERGIGRQRELEADKAGAEASSPHALATSLLKVGAFAPIWDSIRSAMIEALSQLQEALQYDNHAKTKST